MVVVPPPAPVTRPVAEPMVATAVLLLIHSPLPVALVSVVVVASQIAKVPAIATGVGFTVTVVDLIQPVGRE
jgi:hypothetical protein